MATMRDHQKAEMMSKDPGKCIDLPRLRDPGTTRSRREVEAVMRDSVPSAVCLENPVRLAILDSQVNLVGQECPEDPEILADLPVSPVNL